MAKTDSTNFVINIRRQSKQKALQEALLVPWRQLAESAMAFAEWHMLLLWVRAIIEAADQIPEVVRSVLQSRCPGFLQFQNRERKDNLPLWKALEEWVVEHFFANARAEGWFDALMYYAYKDLRTEQAWTLWERTKAVWRDSPPPKWPTLKEWTTDVLATRSLANAGTEKARAVQALGRVEAGRLRDAVADLLVSRALALWVDSVSRPKQPLTDAVLTELRNRCPELVVSSFEALWGPTLFYRLIRSGESRWRGPARSEGWHSVLRYQIVHHPRYQRLIHYNQRCHDEWSRACPNSYPSFVDWLATADAYCAGLKA
jgi:hypothetical protein